MTPDRPRVLLVDDEPAVLDALQLVLRRHADVVTAPGGPAGLERLAADGPFAVVVSDMRMPGLDGATFLARVRQRAPDTTRVLLTGYAEIGAAIAAVNDGHVFRFLTKPCPPDTLLAAIRHAVDQHRLVLAERELLERTLTGAVKALAETLALASPAAFGRAGRVQATVQRICDELKVTDRWHLEVAATLSQIGCVTLPEATVERWYLGRPLAANEQAMVDRLPRLAEELLGPIPRLGPVRESIAHMTRRYDGTGAPPATPRGEQLPLGARLLKLALDFDVLEAQGVAPLDAVAALRTRSGWYDPRALEALSRAVEGTGGMEVRDMPLADLREGMVFAEDLRTATGLLLVARGHAATKALLERLRNFGAAMGLKGTYRVVVAPTAERGAAAG